MRCVQQLSVVAILAAAAFPAFAYIGPGSGISVIGSLLGLLSTILITVAAIALFPIRKLLKKRAQKQLTEDPESPEPGEASREPVKTEGTNTQ
jgi:hypothetical protein